MASTITYRPRSDDPSTKYHLIFFITGNPGLISYYDAFLATLHQLLSEDTNKKSTIYHVFGQSLAGFEDNDTPLTATGAPYSLEQQIQLKLHTLSGQRIPEGPRAGQPYDSVILMGHSVGTYILLEIIQRLKQLSPVPNVKAGVLLMPTIMGLAESPSGVKASPLFAIPGFVRTVALLAKGLVFFVPKSILRWVVGKVLGFSDAGAEVTTRFIKSKMGVWQALYLAQDEMQTITVDKWNKDVWGVEEESSDSKVLAPRLIFYFAEEDHWVANHTRDAIISVRGRQIDDPSSTKPEMIIDHSGIGHAFCIHHSEVVAEKVKIWIEGIVAS